MRHRVFCLLPSAVCFLVSCTAPPGVEPARPVPDAAHPVVLVVPDRAKPGHMQPKPARTDGVVVVDRATGSFFVQQTGGRNPSCVWVRPGRVATERLQLEVRDPGIRLNILLFELQNNGVQGRDLVGAFEQMESRGMIEGRIVWQ